MTMPERPEKGNMGMAETEGSKKEKVLYRALDAFL